MLFRIRSPKDFGAGLLYAGFGVAAILMARGYGMGTASAFRTNSINQASRSGTRRTRRARSTASGEATAVIAGAALR